MSNRLVAIGQNSLIPIKATGKLGDEFFDKPEYEPNQMELLRKKERHQELRDKGYLVKDKLNEDVPDDIPFYEIFDPPNENYRKIFYPQDLKSQVAYYYHSPHFENNEQFLVDEEDIEQAEQAIKYQEEANRRKESKLQRLNQQFKKQKELEAEIERRQRQDQAIENVKRERILSKQPISSPSKNQPKKVSPHLPFKNYGLAIVGPKGKMSMQKDNKINKTNKIVQKQQQKTEEDNDNQKKKTVTFAEEDEVKYIPKNWKSSSEEFRELIKQNKKSKKLK
ncbi:unnamed protein product (macronuclear) [Paramecium tetraurelia]|uniref:Nuclear speckle splicing regulatory protein 1 N-terminal domain-containing protein n=1 Tax=Paramecium tetraurelia TaxID=5888 RepID=A0CIZ0_PARTE|nr:uncharacterized protein GSPATT00007892001 [Paramecium tetraurelia]CAK70757.1 unnamed protein product [Paramecium tetraurelia]|eukprot:XP_001438154.1 hypothetical protein (macronuclear) [Paramecium tetraurelia strain d4-2]